MNRAQFVGGIVLVVVAAVALVVGGVDNIAIPMTFGLVGIALILISRR